MYWRGPAWFNINWLLIAGLRAVGEDGTAALLSAAALEAASPEFPEYVDPVTLAPHGVQRFGWTAALSIDLAHGGASLAETLEGRAHTR